MNRYIDGLKYPQSHPFRKDSDKLLNRIHTDTKIENGIVRWKSNNDIPPKEVLEFWKFIGIEFNYEECLKVQEAENKEFFNNYRKNYKGPSEEELCEMRAAFGRDTTIIDIITGKEIKL